MSHAKRMDDGFSTIITLANVPNIKLYEKDVTPMGFSGGGPIDTTTMRNTLWRTSSEKSLKTLTPASATVAYATESLNDFRDQINVRQQITITYPDSSTMVFWGYLAEFTPAAHVEGEQPTANIVLQPTNEDLDNVETGPEYSVPSGES